MSILYEWFIYKWNKVIFDGVCQGDKVIFSFALIYCIIRHLINYFFHSINPDTAFLSIIISTINTEVSLVLL